MLHANESGISSSYLNLWLMCAFNFNLFTVVLKKDLHEYMHEVVSDS